MPFPTDNQTRDRIKAVLQTLQIPSESDPTVLEPPRYIIFTEWPESFDEGESIDVLRSENDPYVENGVTHYRVNAWLLAEGSFSQQKTPERDSRGLAIPNLGGSNRLTRQYRIFYFYQFGGGGARRVSTVIEAFRKRLNELPKLGFSAEYAEFVDGHDGLQMPFEDEGDFKGVIAYIRGGLLTVRFTEPLATI